MKHIRSAALALMFAGTSALAQAPSSEDRLIQSRAVAAVIWGMPAVNYDLMLQAALKAGARENEIVYWSKPSDWHNHTLTPNPDAIYRMTFFNTKDGPIVLDLPAGNSNGSFNGNIVTVWQMPLEDAGLLGADRGAGGKFVVLPPGYTGKVPAGYITLQSDTFGGYALLRSNLASHSDANVAKSIAYGKKFKIYPLAHATHPPETVFTDAKDVTYDSTIRYDASYF